jgi:galactokinase
VTFTTTLVRTLDESGVERVWFEPALALLESLPRHSDSQLRDFIEPDRTRWVARAPGRLDVMGGIADYSGATVLELPLAAATFAIAQAVGEPVFEVVSLRSSGPSRFRMPLDALRGELRTREALAGWFAAHPVDRWASYVTGLLQYCVSLTDTSDGVRLLLSSEVPEGKGVSSSAALEVASLCALAARYGLALQPAEIAAVCQAVENRVVGAPCGIMDQMTSACGRRDRLLRLRCQPAEVEGQVAIPEGWRFFGIDSGIRHAVTGADYGTVRTAAFMGYRILADRAGFPCEPAGEGVVVHDPAWRGYLANVGVAEFESRYRDALPAEMAGAVFLKRYGGTTDPVSRVHPDRTYPVRQATAHPIHEDERVRRFAELLGRLHGQPDAALQMGALMYESHDSYGACGLGSEGTDRLVALVRAAGPSRGLFGAKITGGGSGGTVGILGHADAEPAVREIAADYTAMTGREATVFAASGPGAAETGILALLHRG